MRTCGHASPPVVRGGGCVSAQLDVPHFERFLILIVSMEAQHD
jgi:hypothetical protein